MLCCSSSFAYEIEMCCVVFCFLFVCINLQQRHVVIYLDLKGVWQRITFESFLEYFGLITIKSCQQSGLHGRYQTAAGVASVMTIIEEVIQGAYRTGGQT